MIEFDHVTKKYGATLALDDLSLTIDEPGIYCLLGRNGAGKTTFLKSLAGHIPISTGKIEVNSVNVTPLTMPHDVRFVETEASQFNIRLLDLFKDAESVNPHFDAAFAKDAASRFKLDTHKRYDHLSFGMKAMVNTLLALSSGKDILLLDEPVLGFDPVMRRTFYDMLSQCCADNDTTVIVSTHIIDEIEKTADHLIVIDKGKAVLFCDLTEIDEKAYTVTGLADDVLAATKGLNILDEKTVGGFCSADVFDKRIPVNTSIKISALTLSDFFVALVGDKEGE